MAILTSYYFPITIHIPKLDADTWEERMAAKALARAHERSRIEREAREEENKFQDWLDDIYMDLAVQDPEYKETYTVAVMA